jgi:hypothetical protein
MDTLTFHAPILYRHLTFSEAKKAPISEINLQAALEGLDMDMSTVCVILLQYKGNADSLGSSSTCAFCWDAIIWNR